MLNQLPSIKKSKISSKRLALNMLKYAKIVKRPKYVPCH